MGNISTKPFLQELLGFILSHFSSGPDARRLTELLESRFRGEPNLLATKVSKAVALAPVVGTLSGLYRAEQGIKGAGEGAETPTARCPKAALLESWQRGRYVGLFIRAKFVCLHPDVYDADNLLHSC